MLKLKIYGRVTDEMSRLFISEWMESDELAFSLNSVKHLVESNPNENDIELEIHGYGGSVAEGFAVYDYLRTSGKNIHANIIGECHSMFLTLLLAAPLENRSANPNVSALAHRVNVGMFGTYSSKQIADMQEMMTKDEEKIIDVYVARTGKDRETMRAVMDAEKELNAKELLEYGFISKINEYNTNLVRGNMNEEQIQEVLTRANAAVKPPVAAPTEVPVTKNVFKDGENPVFEYTEMSVGSDVVFSNEQTGGAFVSGEQVIIINDSKITNIVALGEVTELRSRNSVLSAENTALKAERTNDKQVITDLSKAVQHLQQNVKTTGAPAYTETVTTVADEKDVTNASKVDKKNVLDSLDSFKSGKRPKKQ